jgi:hypothetical protein
VDDRCPRAALQASSAVRRSAPPASVCRSACTGPICLHWLPRICLPAAADWSAAP